MKEIRIHGRGGQGAVTAAYILAVSAHKDGKFSQAFPKFGVERRGAPVESYARIDSKMITIRSQIYSPDYLIVLDPTIPKDILTMGVHEGTVAVINSGIGMEIPGVEVHTVDVTSKAKEILGKPIVNTAMIAAFSAITGEFDIESIKDAISKQFSGELAKKNIRLVEEVYKEAKSNG